MYAAPNPQTEGHRLIRRLYTVDAPELFGGRVGARCKQFHISVTGSPACLHEVNASSWRRWLRANNMPAVSFLICVTQERIVLVAEALDRVTLTLQVILGAAYTRPHHRPSNMPYPNTTQLAEPCPADGWGCRRTQRCRRCVRTPYDSVLLLQGYPHQRVFRRLYSHYNLIYNEFCGF